MNFKQTFMPAIITLSIFIGCFSTAIILVFFLVNPSKNKWNPSKNKWNGQKEAHAWTKQQLGDTPYILNCGTSSNFDYGTVTSCTLVYENKQGKVLVPVICGKRLLPQCQLNYSEK